MNDLDVAFEHSFVPVVLLLLGLWGAGVAATFGL